MKVRGGVFSMQNILILLIPTLMIAWLIGTISSLSKNWALQQEIAEAELKKEYLTLEIEALELENDYYESEEYQELTARRLLNKKLDGETMVYLPENTIKAKTKYSDPIVVGKTQEMSNFQQWMKYLFGV